MCWSTVFHNLSKNSSKIGEGKRPKTADALTCTNAFLTRKRSRAPKRRTQSVIQALHGARHLGQRGQRKEKQAPIDQNQGMVLYKSFKMQRSASYNDADERTHGAP